MANMQDVPKGILETAAPTANQKPQPALKIPGSKPPLPEETAADKHKRELATHLAEERAQAEGILNYVANDITIQVRDELFSLFSQSLKNTVGPESMTSLALALAYNKPVSERLFHIAQDVIRGHDIHADARLHAEQELAKYVTPDAASAKIALDAFIAGCQGRVLDIDLGAMERGNPQPRMQIEVLHASREPTLVASSTTGVDLSERIKAHTENLQRKRATRTGDTGPGQLTP